MARIAGIDIPPGKRIEIALTYIYGIGPSTAKQIVHDSRLNVEARVKDLTEEEVNHLREIID